MSNNVPNNNSNKRNKKKRYPAPNAIIGGANTPTNSVSAVSSAASMAANTNSTRGFAQGDGSNNRVAYGYSLPSCNPMSQSLGQTSCNNLSGAGNYYQRLSAGNYIGPTRLPLNSRLCSGDVPTTTYAPFGGTMMPASYNENGTMPRGVYPLATVRPPPGFSPIGMNGHPLVGGAVGTNGFQQGSGILPNGVYPFGTNGYLPRMGLTGNPSEIHWNPSGGYPQGHSATPQLSQEWWDMLAEANSNSNAMQANFASAMNSQANLLPMPTSTLAHIANFAALGEQNAKFTASRFHEITNILQNISGGDTDWEPQILEHTQVIERLNRGSRIIYEQINNFLPHGNAVNLGNASRPSEDMVTENPATTEQDVTARRMMDAVDHMLVMMSQTNTAMNFLLSTVSQMYGGSPYFGPN